MDKLNRDKLIYFIFGVVIALATFKSLLVGYLIITALVIWGLYTFLKSVSHKERSKLKRTSESFPRLPRNDRLMQEIVLLAGSPTTASRLFQSYQQKYPQKNERWCKEKIIFDLKRDRGVT